MRIRDLARNALRPGWANVMTRKVVARVSDRGRSQGTAALAWARDHAISTEELVGSVDPSLWIETIDFAESLKTRASAVLADADGIQVQASQGFDGPFLGGGGNYPLLYFLTRLVRPATVVETGVGAGFSSQAVLSAMERNGVGALYSSDFPYFRLQDPQRYVGLVVEQSLRGRWKLMIEGDRRNLRRIVRECGPIDLFHYDSDKTYAGREYGLSVVTPKLSARAVILMDDVQDNLYFRDCFGTTVTPFSVVEFEGKFTGVVGLNRWIP